MCIRDRDYVTKRTPQATLTAIYGMAWLYTARFALQASNAMFFSTGQVTRPEFRDNYLTVYINNEKFASEFRKNTDFLGGGGVIDFASDLLGEGVPTKTFRAGNVIFINRDAGPEEQSSNSITAIQGDATGWKISLKWDGKSENTMFENIKNEKSYTSFSMLSQNLDFDAATLEGKKIKQDFFDALVTLAPVLNIIILRLSLIHI